MTEKDKENGDKIIKIILVGDAGVGKTSIINRFHYNTFNINSPPTIVMNYVEKRIKIKDNNTILYIWDTAGQEQYKSINKLFIKDSKIVIFVYDITSRKSFNNLEYWYNFIEDELGQYPSFALLGNKMDLYEVEEVKEEEGRELADSWGAYFSLVSAKNEGDLVGINYAFEAIVKLYLGRRDNNTRSKTIVLTEYNSDQKEERINNCCGNAKIRNKIKEKYINIIFLGEKGVGKTSLIQGLLGQKTNEKYHHTNNIMKYKYICSIDNYQKINVKIIDTNGDPINKNNDLKLLAKYSKIFFLIIDINNKDTFNKLEDWVNDIKKYSAGKNIFINILGNKIKKTQEDNNYITNEEGEKVAKNLGCYYESISNDKINLLKRYININVEKYLKC